MAKKKVINNLVAKYAFDYNKSAVHIDRKKELKRGKRVKHKSHQFSGSFL